MKIFAHRGESSAAPENTMAAYEAAIRAGADGIELDVQAARDGTPVVIHDEALLRTTGAAGQVGDLTAAELAALDAGGWFGPDFAGQRIPTLAAVLELLRPTSLQLNIEFKTARVAYPGLVPAVVELVAGMGLSGRVQASSFNHLTLLEVRELAANLETAAIVYGRMVEPWSYAARHGFHAVHPTHHAVTPELVERCHAAGVAVRAWTVNDAEVARAMAAQGVDGIITDMPRQAREWCGGTAQAG